MGAVARGVVLCVVCRSGLLCPCCPGGGGGCPLVLGVSILSWVHRSHRVNPCTMLPHDRRQRSRIDENRELSDGRRTYSSYTVYL